MLVITFIKCARKISEKLTFLTPLYAHVCVLIRGLEMLVFQKILHTHLMDHPLYENVHPKAVFIR